MSKIKTFLSKIPKWVYAAAVIILVVALIVYAAAKIGSQKYGNLRKPIENNKVAFSANAPGPQELYTDSDGISRLGSIQKLRLEFDSDVSFGTAQENEKLKNITISPDLKGKWAWEGSSTLAFTPEKDWDADKAYQITLPKDIVGANTDQKTIELAAYTITVKTAPFSMDVNSFKIYQDPQNPRNYHALAQITFSHAVTPSEFEKNISLNLDGKALPYAVSYDEFKRNASIKSEPIKILDNPRLVNLDISKFNGSKVGKTLDIPPASKFFSISNVKAQIVRNDQDEPQQILAVEFTDGVAETELQNKVHAYLLPLKNPSLKNRSKQAAPACEPAPCDCSDDDEDCECPDSDCDNSDNYSTVQWIPADITPDVLAKLTPLPLTPLPGAETYNKVYTYQFDADRTKNEYIYAAVDGGLTSSGGFEIKKDQGFVVSVPSYPKEVKIVGTGALLSLAGSKKLSFVSRGVDGIKTEISRILPGRINNLVSQTSGNFQEPYFKDSYYFNENDISENFSEIIPVIKNNQKASYSSLDLGTYLTPGKTGLFLLKVYGWDIKNKYSQTGTNTRFILVTDMGMLAKKDAGGNYKVYVMSVSSGAPVSGVKVEVLGRNGIPLFTKFTDGQGLASFPPLKDFNNEKYPTAFVATNGTDVSFMPVSSYDRQLDYSRFDTEGAYSAATQSKALSSFLFTDRGLYRPGDDINIAAITKTQTWSLVAGVPVRFVLKNPNNKTIFEKKFSLDAAGFNDFTISTEPVFPTGTYNAYIYDISDEKRPSQLGSVSLRLEEFQEDKLKIKANILGANKKGWQPLEGLSAKVTLENMFGTPAQGNRVRADITLAPLTFRFPKFKDFTFQDPYLNPKKANYQQSAQTLIDDVTDAQGTVQKDIDLSAFADGSYSLSLTAEGFEQESGASVYGADTTWVSPNRYLVGFKSKNNLNYIKRGSDAAVDFIAVNPDLEQIALDKLTIKVIAMQYVSTLVKQYDGTYKYQSVLKEEEKSSAPFSVGKTGVTMPLDTSAPGRYALEVYDEFNKKLARAEYFVTGSANLNYSLEKDAELSLTLENKEVAPGEDLTLNIIAPYTGAGLITIERDKVYAQKWFRASSTSTQQTITVPADFEGNGYVNVSFVRGADSREIFTSPHSYAVLPFYVKRDKRTINIDLNTPETVKPGDTLEVKYKTSQDSKIVIYGVSEGILQVAKYSLPKPLDTFLRKMALEVKTYQILDMILPDFKVVREFAGTGGDMEEEAANMLAANLNPFARKRDKPVVFWSGVIDASTSEKTYKYTVPSYFNGEIRVMAVAANKDAAGSASVKTKVRAPIIIMSGNPFAVAPGDVFDASARVSNNLPGSDGKITVDMSVSEQLEIVGPKTASLDIPYGSEKTAQFKVKALDKLGGATITYTAKNANPSEIMTAQNTLSVRPATVFSTVLTTAVIPAGTEIKNFQRDMYPYMTSREINISNSPLVVAKGLAKFFEAFPHGCSEQLTSQVFPFLALAPVDGKGVLDRTQVETTFKNVVEKLRRRQMSNGRFAMWDGGSYDNPDVDMYVTNFLLDAKEEGYSVPADMLSNALNLMDDFAAKYPSTDYEAANAAYAAYLLARSGKVVTNYLARTTEYLDKNVKNWQNTLTGAYIASAYMLLKDEAKADVLISQFKPEGNKFIFYSDYDSTSIRNARFMYLLGKHFPSKVAQYGSIVRGLVDAIVNNNYNTLSGSQTILALTAYASAMSDKDILINLSESKGGAYAPVALDRTGFPSYKFGADTTAFKADAQETGPLGLFYIISTQGFDKNPPDVSQAKGLEVTREYLDKDGKAVTSAKLGDELTVKIKFRATAKNGVSNVAIIDLLPGAFEAVSGSVTGYMVDFYDLREDRALIYLTATKNIKEISYKVKATAAGDFTAPMLYAYSLYDTDTSGLVKAGRFTVTSDK
ncbi:MAG: alpha-2-macroglobulin family protein [Elusimicrobia bacterium]|nr:alpha-2-macroglobulin family protein [Elusimicrobiota bacterium]